MVLPALVVELVPLDEALEVEAVALEALREAVDAVTLVVAPTVAEVGALEELALAVPVELHAAVATQRRRLNGTSALHTRGRRTDEPPMTGPRHGAKVQRVSSTVPHDS